MNVEPWFYRGLRRLYGPQIRENAFETGVFSVSAGRKTLTLRARAPIRPRFLEMDEIWTPAGRARAKRFERRGGRRVSKMSRGCEQTAKGPPEGRKRRHPTIKTKRG